MKAIQYKRDFKTSGFLPCSKHASSHPARPARWCMHRTSQTMIRGFICRRGEYKRSPIIKGRMSSKLWNLPSPCTERRSSSRSVVLALTAVSRRCTAYGLETRPAADITAYMLLCTRTAKKERKSSRCSGKYHRISKVLLTEYTAVIAAQTFKMCTNYSTRTWSMDLHSWENSTGTKIFLPC